MAIPKLAKTSAAPLSGSQRLMSPLAFAKMNLGKGVEITALFTGRGGGNLLQNQKKLAAFKVGEFEGQKVRQGHLTNTVFKVRTAGPDDRQVDRIIVRVGVGQPNDTVKYKYVDLGPMAKGGPNV